ncbi:MAG: glycosyltransferase family 4 protein [Candidatus Micrarchaeota archaeon]|nr:glycosyltransferase family 4 protein [Candidatus Micrarchaeota archaeon]
MKIALLNTIKPGPGSGDGITEYTYQISQRLKKGNTVDLVYPLEESKRNDIFGLVYANSVFKLRIRNLAKEGYDVIHITNQELGFAAKMLKRLGTRAKIITSIHDLMRVKDLEGYHKGLLQDAYNNMVASSIHDAVDFSDHIIFTASTVNNDAEKRFPQMKKHVTTLLCPKDQFRTVKIPNSKKGGTFKVGYIGALAFRKNVIFILKTAKRLKDKAPNVKFLIYGSGAEKENLIAYKEKNDLTNVTFMGFAQEKTLMQTYDSFDLFFFPTMEEGSSLPILDAQARGLPALVLKENNLDEEVTRCCMKTTGEADAAKAILNLSRNGYNSKEREKSTKYARSFSWDRVAKETFAVYKKA